MQIDVTAVVVTCNRHEALERSLAAICRQTCPVRNLILVDNGSDDTIDILKRAVQDTNLTATHLQACSNFGGAGGFYIGMRYAFENTKSQWFWIMDDDCEPNPDALSKLMEVSQQAVPFRHAGFPTTQSQEKKTPVLLASLVLWKDGQIHPRNLVSSVNMLENSKRFVNSMKNGCTPIRTATFVSLAVSRESVADHGYPLPKYFLWGDDTEYSSRLTHMGPGLLVADSQVVHATDDATGLFDAPPDRFWFHVRNSMWTITRAPYLSCIERVILSCKWMSSIIRYLIRKRFSLSACAAVLKGTKQGLFLSSRSPKSLQGDNWRNSIKITEIYNQ